MELHSPGRYYKLYDSGRCLTCNKVKVTLYYVTFMSFCDIVEVFLQLGQNPRDIFRTCLNIIYYGVCELELVVMCS